MNRTICQGETYSFNNQLLTTNGNYSTVYTTSYGCDSTVALNQEVVNTNNTITMANNGLQANTIAGATYQWVDCSNNNTPISQQTGSMFVPSVGGNYAVITTLNGCSSISNCIASTVGIQEISKVFQLYPNPATTSINVEFSNNTNMKSISIVNNLGQIIYTTKNINAPISIENLANGVYYIHCTASDNTNYYKPFTVLK